MNKPSLLCLVLSAHSGCSVLTVNVDVYKGPLANHCHVQTEQMAVMAMGAKPLLLRLRDLKEENETGKNSKFEPKYVPPDPSGASRFSDPLANCVNGILYLYEDRCPSDSLLNSLLKRGKNAIDMYNKSYSIIRQGNQAEDQKLWEEVHEMLKSPPGNLWANLVNAYRDFLCNEWKEAKGLLKKAFEVEVNPPNEKEALINSSNAAFAYLADSEIVDRHSYNLRLTGSTRRRFVVRVKEISNAFIDARSALEEIWSLTLEIMITMHSGSIGKASPRMNSLNKKFASFIVRLIQPEHLRGFYILVKNIGKDKDLIPSFLREYLENPPKDPRKFDKALIALIADSPIDSAKALQAMHTYSKTSEFWDLLKKRKIFERESMAFPEGWKFGLVLGPTKDLGSNVIEDFQRTLSSISEVFAGGRLDDGLETIIENYLKIANKAEDKETEEVKEARQQLLDELIHFAEKLLFLGNNELLINPPQAGGGIFGIYKNVILRNILDVAPTIKGINIANLLYGVDTSQYIQVLQVVGNSILVQADELRHRVEHEKRLKSNKRLEASALMSWYDRDVPEIIDSLIDGIRAEKSEAIHRKTEKKVEASGAMNKALNKSCEIIYRAIVAVVNQINIRLNNLVKAIGCRKGAHEIIQSWLQPIYGLCCKPKDFQDELSKYNDVIDLIKALKSDIATQAKHHDSKCSPDLVFRIILSKARNALSEINSGDKSSLCLWAELSRESQQKKLNNAIKVLEGSIILMAPPEVRNALLLVLEPNCERKINLLKVLADCVISLLLVSKFPQEASYGPAP